MARRLTADAVVFSLSRQLVLFRNFHEQFINQIVALDPLTVEIQLKTPYAPFISTLAGTSFSIVSPAAIQNLGEHPVGTGPFKFVRWEKGDKNCPQGKRYILDREACIRLHHFSLYT